MNRAEAAAAVAAEGWSFLLDTYAAAVDVGSMADALDVASRAIAACGDDAGHLRVDLRPGRVDLLLAPARPDPSVAALARAITAALAGVGRATVPRPGTDRPVQQLEIAIDALDIPAVVPFWRAVLAYVDDGAEALVDPAGQGPAFWFQQMDEPRPQRNRIHFDVSVRPEDAPARIEAALAAGGHLVSDRRAPAFWILADSEGNEICVCTWQGRD